MSESSEVSARQAFLGRATEATIRIGLLIALVGWCFSIVRPFVTPVAWGVILAVALHPVYRLLQAQLGGRSRLAAVGLVLASLVVLIVPTALLAGTLVEGVRMLAERLDAETPLIPMPPESVQGWPLVGAKVYEVWLHASGDLPATLAPLRPQLLSLGKELLSTAAGAGFAFLQTLLAVGIAGALLANDRGGMRLAKSLGRRLAGERGEDFSELAGATVRSVSQGILGVALIQSLLAGLGFLVVGVPGAGLWALVGLLLCVIQLGVMPIALPIMIYVFATAELWVSIPFAIWTSAVSLLDNILKPLLLGRGVRVPTLVIFVGSIGGFLSAGIIGLFVGSVVLVLGYTLIAAWLAEAEGSAEGA